VLSARLVDDLQAIQVSLLAQDVVELADGSGWTPVGSLIHTWAWSSKTQVTWSLAGYLLVVQFVSFSLWKILQKVGDTYITHVSYWLGSVWCAKPSHSTPPHYCEAALFHPTATS
jgi:hypothetical protein